MRVKWVLGVVSSKCMLIRRLKRSWKSETLLIRREESISYFNLKIFYMSL